VPQPTPQDVRKIVEIKARKAEAEAERTHVRDQGFRPMRNTEIGDFANVLHFSLYRLPPYRLPLRPPAQKSSSAPLQNPESKRRMKKKTSLFACAKN
jgi:hypothetical protein